MIQFAQPTLGDDDTIIFTTDGHACISIVLSKLDAYREERKAIKGEVEYLSKLYAAQKKVEEHQWIRTN